MMRPYRPVLFDLDGTVADTYPGILRAARAALAEARLAEVPDERIIGLTGRGVPALVDGLLLEVGAEADEVMRARLLKAYEGNYAQTCAEGSVPYPGMVALVKDVGPPRALLTNKPRAYTNRIVERLGLSGIFEAVVAGDEDGVKLKPDPWFIHEALRRLGANDRPILVGDTVSDVDAAAAAGIVCCIVAWGHGAAAAAPLAPITVEVVGDLRRLLCGAGTRAAGSSGLE